MALAGLILAKAGLRSGILTFLEKKKISLKTKALGR